MSEADTDGNLDKATDDAVSNLKTAMRNQVVAHAKLLATEKGFLEARTEHDDAVKKATEAQKAVSTALTAQHSA